LYEAYILINHEEKFYNILGDIIVFIVYNFDINMVIKLYVVK